MIQDEVTVCRQLVASRKRTLFNERKATLCLTWSRRRLERHRVRAARTLRLSAQKGRSATSPDLISISACRPDNRCNGKFRQSLFRPLAPGRHRIRLRGPAVRSRTLRDANILYGLGGRSWAGEKLGLIEIWWKAAVLWFCCAYCSPPHPPLGHPLPKRGEGEKARPPLRAWRKRQLVALAPTGRGMG
jgi:hypothetical protein